MTSFRNLVSATALAVLLTAGPGLARADSDDGHHRMMRHGDNHTMSAPYEHIEGRLAFLKAELKIDEAQTAKWNDFAETARSTAAALAVMHANRKDSDDDIALPQLIERRETIIASHLEMLHKFNASFSPLYALLSRDQKKMAAEIFEDVCPMP